MAHSISEHVLSHVLEQLVHELAPEEKADEITCRSVHLPPPFGIRPASRGLQARFLFGW